MHGFIIFGFLLCSSVGCVNFDVNNVNVISPISNGSRGYFGYSLLLQRGLNPMVIVGAPKGVVDKGGAVYSCDLSGYCKEYMLLVRDPYGNFLGSVLDGDDNVGQPFVACAPRMLKLYGNYASKYYLPGYCLYQKNSSYLSRLDAILSPLANQKEISTASGINYYDYGFSEAGMDMHYIKDSAWVILGAPGVKNWNGAFVVQSLEKPSQFSIFPTKPAPILSENDAYLGYKVTVGRFEKTRTRMSFIAAAPRGNKLFGMVKIFDGALLSRVLTGKELGSYFGGALLATDLNADGIDELLVGAPMGPGNSFDEGYVYVYDSNFKLMTKLTGSRKAGARFGSAIVSLGDIDIDNFNDIAISAPYEDDGVGAVYIYRGNKFGIELVPSQRLSPLNFNGGLENVKGFGQGISRGNDIDDNGHNDLAIGAYKSNQVFVVKTLSIIDYKIALETDISSIPPNKIEIPTNIKYCIYYTQRSKTQNVKTVNFKVELQLDYRTNGTRKFIDKWTVFLAETFCNTLDVIIMQSMLDIQPFQLFMRVEVIDNVFAVGENEMEISIPYAHNCGDDNICHTQIAINLESESTHIILGLDKEFELHIMADNVGEPGYQCRLYLEIPPELEYSERRNCNFDNDVFICPFASILVSSVEMNLKFYVISEKILVDRLEMFFEIKCLGENAKPNRKKLGMDILWHNSPYMQSKSEPEKYIRTDNDIEEDLHLYHTFVIGNYGPSPIKLDVTLLAPRVKVDGMDIFEIVEAKGKMNDVHIPCHSTNESVAVEKSNDLMEVVNEAANRTIVVDCSTDGIKCMEIICDDIYLYKSSQTAKYTINIKVNKKLLASHFQDTSNTKDVVAYLSSAFLSNTTARIRKTSVTLIYQSTKQTISLWIAIVSCILGLLLLVLLVYVLYKCHFFDRTYRDKLHGERLINEHIEMDTTANTTEHETEHNLKEKHKDINS